MERASNILLASNAGAGNGSWFMWGGGAGEMVAEATWGGGNIKLQRKGPNGTAIDIASTTLSANGTVSFTIGRSEIRYVITTATAVYAQANNIPT